MQYFVTWVLLEYLLVTIGWRSNCGIRFFHLVNFKAV